MARRISSKARLQKMQEEKAIEAKEKKAAPKKKKKAAAKKKKAPAKKKTAAKKRAPRKKKAAPAGRMKVVWAVGEPGKASVKEFPFPEKAAAEAEAAKLTKKHGKTFIVKRDRVAMED